MQPKQSIKSIVRRIAGKELTLFFSSPIGYLFLASFAAISLFVFFWAEAFFARNIADVRPLFEWMPILLIFLCSTITMRLWSEERRSGTLEYVITQSVPLSYFVIGKFVACLTLLIIALVLTLPLPLTVSFIGELDWGPVWAGYLATLLLGAAYLSVGLFVSSRSDNQIVSLITSVAVCGLLYLIGNGQITQLFSNNVGDWLRLIGSGSRFDSITRGMIDFRDLYYYLSLVLVFLSLNTYSLEKQRWVTQGRKSNHSRWQAITSLLVLNALAANFWLGQLNHIRVDVTQGKQYSISSATHQYLDQLQEPLLIRGYFSSKTHPLLAPLVPQIKDLLREYEFAGEGQVRVEIIDPMQQPELEKEANQKYGIQPVPFQVADRYQSSIVSSYFNILVQYGDEHKVLGFQELIEVKATGETDINVMLRNPELDITKSIKSVLQAYQSSGNLFDTVASNLSLDVYLSEEQLLPKQLREFKAVIAEVTNDFAAQADGQFQVNYFDPMANNGQIAQEIAENFGFQPLRASLFSDTSFYFYMVLNDSEQFVQIPLSDMNKDEFKRNLEAGIKRFAQGFTKTIAMVKPEPSTPYSPYSQQSKSFNKLESFLSDEFNVKDEDLSDGKVSGDADIMVLMAPDNLSDKQLFAIDQFLMRGGTIIAATSPYQSDLSNRNLALKEHRSGLEPWLQHHGITIDKKLVMDPQNSAFPVPVTRNVGGFQIQDLKMLDYPYFVDVRSDALNQSLPITSELPQATMMWASPIVINQDDAKDKKQDSSSAQTELNERLQANIEHTALLTSSSGSWLSSSTDVMPRLNANGTTQYTPSGETQSHNLGLLSEGRFVSYFANKENPLIQQQTSSETDTDNQSEASAADESDSPRNETKNEQDLEISSVIERSPESARIILFSSNDFLSDRLLQVVSSTQQTEYLNTIQLVANAIDWSLDDSGLLSIRSRGHFNRTLPPMAQQDQAFLEYINYGTALLLIVLIAFFQRVLHNRKQRQYLEQLAQ